MIDLPGPGPETGFELIPLADQLRNHDEYCRASVPDLAGMTLDYLIDDVDRLSVHFDTNAALHWRSESASEDLTAVYHALDLRPDLYFVVVSRLPERRSDVLIADLAAGRALLNATSFVESDGQGVSEITTFAHLGAAGTPTRPFERTTELVGKRVHHRYSSTHAFEHLYLNPNTYAFHCLEGPEAGLAEVDRCDMFKIADDLFLISWHEHSQPFNGAVCVDLGLGRATGRLVGWDPPSQQVLQARTGTQATLLNQTRYAGL